MTARVDNSIHLFLSLVHYCDYVRLQQQLVGCCISRINEWMVWVCCRLVSIQNHSFDAQRKLTELRLDYNKISFINNGTWSGLRDLTILSLRDNFVQVSFSIPFPIPIQLVKSGGILRKLSRLIGRFESLPTISGFFWQSF